MIGHPYQHGDGVRLTVMVKLPPSESQAQALEVTLRRVNAACDYASEVAWETRTFGKYNLQQATYHLIKERFSLTAQVVIRLLAKVADAYKLDKRTQRIFRPLGAIAYDNRVLRWYADEVSIWTVGGRERIPFVCDDRTLALLKHRRGESELVYRNGKWYLLATVEVEELPPGTPEDWLGVDLGVVNIATDSDGETHVRAYGEVAQEVRTHPLQAPDGGHEVRKTPPQEVVRQRAAVQARHELRPEQAHRRQGGRVRPRHSRGIALEDLKGIRDCTGKR